MSDEPAIRRARIPDLRRVSEFAGELVRLHHTTDTQRFFLPDRVEEGYASWLRRELRNKNAVVLVAERHSELAGYAYGTIEARDWNALLDEHGAIHDVFVTSTGRRAGIGKLLVEGISRELESLGASSIVLSTMVGNEAAQRLFQGCGFRPTMLEMTRSRGQQ
jgi:ribosomal protein S18 acetylase RimI-like enzyme